MDNSIAQKFNTKSLLLFTLPSMIMMVFCSIYSMAGSIFASQFISQSAMSATTVVFPLASVILAISIMFTTGSNAIIANNMGQGNLSTARENFTIIFLLGTVVGLLCTIFTLTFDDQIIAALGGNSDPVIYDYCKTYLRALSVTFPFTFWTIYAQYFFVTIGKPLLGMTVVIIGGIFNVLTNFTTIVVLELGIVGVAMGTFTSSFIPGVVFVLYFATHKNCALHFVKPKLHKGFVLNTCTNGSSEMVTNLAIAIVTAVLNVLVVRFVGAEGLAAVTVIVQTQFLLNSLYIGFGAGVAPIFAFANGENNTEQTKRVFHISIKFVAISSVIIVAMCLIFAPHIVSVFVAPTSSVFALAKSAFTIFALGFLFSGLNIFSSIFFTSVSNGKISALISFLRTFAFILGMLMILPEIIGVNGLWLSLPIAEALSLVISIFLLKKYRSTYHY